ncbi:hypothetical protein GT037_011050 [Alternaria burnsii]|uniref:Amidase domain-containing protein n=1 Tax=Alternaria burnsii TaxID=1187904 RepID=A0A8H7AX31_9PLEO|nr:uncharacterized protein GT037_011050 [Alternaria burnsii]KAF7670922.1 hypothetical protein GT037_011050 [Alternaria burnsii]
MVSPRKCATLLSLDCIKTLADLPQPNRILYPTDWYPQSNANQQAMTDAFVRKLEEYLGITTTKLSVLKEWEKTAPAGTNSSLIDYLDMSAYAVNGFFGYHNFDDFRTGYLEKFGKKPYVSPSHTARWERNSKYTVEDKDLALKKLQVFKKCGGDSGPDPKSYDEIFVTSILGCPQLVVPIGQNSYDSDVSGLVEYAPIVTTLIGPSHSDKLLVEVASNTLKKAGWPSSVLTGRFMFEKGDNERNTAPREKL